MYFVKNIVFLIASVLFVGCSSIGVKNDLKRVVVLDVQLSRQTDSKLCGLEVVKMLSGFHKKPISKEAQKILTELGQNKNGILGLDLKKVLNAENYFTVVVPGTLDWGVAGIYQQLDHKNPVIVMLGAQEAFHYILIIGYDPTTKKIIFMDPKVGRYVATEEWFLEKWKLANNFTIISYPKEKEFL